MDGGTSSDWFGAMIRYVFFLGKKDFEELYKQNPRNFFLNALIGWAFKVLFVAFLIFIAVMYSRKP